MFSTVFVLVPLVSLVPSSRPAAWAIHTCPQSGTLTVQYLCTRLTSTSTYPLARMRDTDAGATNSWYESIKLAWRPPPPSAWGWRLQIRSAADRTYFDVDTVEDWEPRGSWDLQPPGPGPLGHQAGSLGRHHKGSRTLTGKGERQPAGSFCNKTRDLPLSFKL